MSEHQNDKIDPNNTKQMQGNEDSSEMAEKREFKQYTVYGHDQNENTWTVPNDIKDSFLFACVPIYLYPKKSTAV